MIRKSDLLEMQLEIQKAFQKMERRISDLENELAKQELRHKAEIQQLEMSISHTKAIEDLKAKQASAPVETEAEKLAREKAERRASVMMQYCEDPETLQKLGFNIPVGGGNE